MGIRRLPEMCAMLKPGTSVPIIVRRGQPGYTTAPHLKDPTKMETFNEQFGVTIRDQAAMWAGSQHGFHTRQADPAAYTSTGELRELPEGTAQVISFTKQIA